jgi:hypothetical protein
MDIIFLIIGAVGLVCVTLVKIGEIVDNKKNFEGLKKKLHSIDGFHPTYFFGKYCSIIGLDFERYFVAFGTVEEGKFGAVEDERKYEFIEKSMRDISDIGKTRGKRCFFLEIKFSDGTKARCCVPIVKSNELKEAVERIRGLKLN